MIRSLVFTTQGRLHSKDIEMFLMPTLLTDTNLFLWVDLENPTAEETKYVLEDVFHFHPLSIEDCVMASPSPKVEEYTPKEEDRFAPYLFMVIHAVDYSRKDGVFATSELNFFLGKNFLVTYHEGVLRSVTQAEETRDPKPPCISPARRTASRTTSWIRSSRITNRLSTSWPGNRRAGAAGTAGHRHGDDQQNLQIKKEVLHLRQIIGPQREVLARFARGEFKLIRAHLVPYYRDVYDALFQISELAQGYTDSLTGILQVYLNMSSNRTGEVVKLLTMITVITTPLMMVGTWYGMNFKHMPEVDWRHGYLVAGLVTVGSTFATYWYFKRRNGSESWQVKSVFLTRCWAALGGSIPRACKPSFSAWRGSEVSSKPCSTPSKTACWWWMRVAESSISIKPSPRCSACNPTSKDSPSCISFPTWIGRKSPASMRTGGQGVVRHEFEVHYPRSAVSTPLRRAA